MYRVEEKNTMYYLKLFLLMIIPIYGFFFTALLAFSKDVSYELKCLAKGAFVARIVFVLFILVLGVLLITFFIPMINDFFSNYNLLKLLR